MQLKINRSLISVSDKRDLLSFAFDLQSLGVEIYSTGGTAKTLQDAQIKAVNISDVTGFPEMLGGRVKTLHPKIFAGILAKREDPEHMQQMQQMSFSLIDLVVVNLYPFSQVVKKLRVTLDEAIENIDIGGPSLIRASAKNFLSVAVVVDPVKYSQIIEELKKQDGCLSLETRKNLAIDAFNHTFNYDKMIYEYLSEKL